MPSPCPSVPWNRPALWRQAHASLSQTLRHHSRALAPCRVLACRIEARLTAIFPLMAQLCSDTCPTCKDICCQRAWVWADFKDLLFWHLAGIPLPGRQLLEQRGDRCRYGAADGCRLARIQRPFVCTWYLCPAQTRILRDLPAEKAMLNDALQRIKHLRRQMEDGFIRTVG